MNSATIAVHWHDDNQPVYLVCFQPGAGRSSRLVTGGGDNNVRIWKINYGPASEPRLTTVEYLSTLRKHTQAVNAVRFDPKGEILATAGDDGLLILWTLSDHIVHDFGHTDDDVKESWVVKQIHNTSLEIYDILWLPDSKYIATGSMDNITKVYDVQTGQKHCELADHSHYVQGVAWDPRNDYLATQSADRSLHIYSLKKNDAAVLILPTLFFKIVRAELPVAKLSGITSPARLETVLLSTESSPKIEAEGNMQPPAHNYVHHVELSPPRKAMPSESLPAVKPIPGKRLTKSSLLYHSETLQSFFRRLAFSPDGSLLLTPLGIFKHDDTEDESAEHLNTVYIYIRSGLNRPPVCHIPGLSKPAVAIAFSPLMYKRADETLAVFSLPYKMVFAVATQDAVIVYDTESLRPLGSLSNLHYSTITDLCWDSDGLNIMASSAEGFCSVISFAQGTFGDAYANALASAGHSAVPPATKGEEGIGEVPIPDTNFLHGKDNRTSGATDHASPAKDASCVSEAGTIASVARFLPDGQSSAKTFLPSLKVLGTPPASSTHLQLQLPPLHASTHVVTEAKELHVPNVQGPAQGTGVSAALLSQFMAPVVDVGDTPSKKRRVAPTLLSKPT